MVEHVGAATWDESMRSLKTAGTFVTCGATTGAQRSKSIFGIYLRVSCGCSVLTWEPWRN